MLKAMKRWGCRDDYQSPARILDYLLHYVPTTSIIWECAEGKGFLTNSLLNRGYRVIGSDILTGQDFLSWVPKEKYDMILTNPPYSTKNQFIARCYELKKPWALLMPINALESIDRQKFYRQYGLQVICLPFRPDFYLPDGEQNRRGGSFFAAAWFTYGLSLPKDLIFGI